MNPSKISSLFAALVTKKQPFVTESRSLVNQMTRCIIYPENMIKVMFFGIFHFISLIQPVRTKRSVEVQRGRYPAPG